MLKRVNCWAHCVRLFDERLTHVKDLVVRREMREELRYIQTSYSPVIFNKACELWCLERSGKDPQVDDFITYFKEFLTTKPGWYEGYSGICPSQTNGLEGTHKDMKAFEGIKTRCPTIRFVRGKGKNLVEEWSKARSSNFGDIVKIQTFITLATQIKALNARNASNIPSI